MKLPSLCIAIGLLSVVPAFAAITGTVVNSTRGAAQAGVPVTLVKPGQGGMKTLGQTTTDTAGRFTFAHDEPGGGPQLLQAQYGGVNYNKLLTPNISTTGVELNIYEVTKTPELVHVAERMLVFDATLGRIGVTETVVVQNASKQTYNNPKVGDLRFYLPPAANGQVRVEAQGPQGMPLPQAAEKAEGEDLFKINFPIKPGETQYQITYVMPAGSPFVFHGEVVNTPGIVAEPLRLVAPPGVTLSGKQIQQLGVEPQTQATIYNVLAKEAFTVNIEGTGSLRGNSEDQAAGPSEDESPQVTEGNPKVYAHLGWMAGLALGILAVGLLVLYRSSPVRA